jgi:hypothetical protein
MKAKIIHKNSLNLREKTMIIVIVSKSLSRNLMLRPELPSVCVEFAPIDLLITSLEFGQYLLSACRYYKMLR